MKKVLPVPLAAALALVMLAATAEAKTVWKPKTTAVLEFRQPSGELRVYHTPSGAVYWSSDLPAVQGDKVIVHAFVSTGEAALKKAIIRMDNKELKVLTQAPWKVEVDSGGLSPGYHFVEVVAFADSRRDIGTAAFMVVPAGDPVLREALAPAPEPAPKVAPQPVVQELVCRVRSRTDATDQHLLKGESIILKESALFWIQAVEGAKEFRYTLKRGGEETYRSPNVPIVSHIMLQPKGADGKGLEPGMVTLSVQAGDGKGGFGPPADVKIQVLGPGG